jgi:putative DNA primase/helicase
MVTKVENIPQELKRLSQWVCWVGSDKVPKNTHTGGNAKSNDASTWGSFEQACKACEQYRFDGVGFMFANGYFGVDLDHCADDLDFCDEFVDALQSYAEFSKSGNGIHIICKGELPDGARRRGNVEMYSFGRYFICTGNVYNPKYIRVAECTESIKHLHEKYLARHDRQTTHAKVEYAIDMSDQEVIDKARNCKTGNLFNILYSGNWQGVYSSQSEADLALCNQLAFWTQRNEEQIDRIFRSSGLMRKKWDEKRSGSTYGAITIGKACANCIEVYEPKKYDDTELALAFFKDGKFGVETPVQYDMTDTGNAHRLQDKFGSIIRYSYNRKRWYYWTGKVWHIDDSGEVKKLADIICDDIKREAFQEQDEKTQADLLKWASKTSSSKGKEAMIKECQHLPGIPVGQDDLDAYNDYLNCKNGIVNLRNGELIPHDSSFMMSKMCGSDYDQTGKKPKLWLSFLNDVTNGNKELQEYIQRSVGYSLTGSTAEQCAYFLYGVGNNGKSTFLDVIANLLGGYSSNVQPETIMLKKWGGDSANSDIARLKGARFVTSEEPTEGVRLNEGLLKQLTGSSRVTCRFLYGDEFEYTPEFKIWVATNHKPVIRGTDVGIWRRIKLIPFEVTIPKEKVDKDLPKKLKAEYPQILKWAVDGCIKWREHGIAEPECIREAVKEYKQEMDLLAGFLEQCVVIDYDIKEKVQASDLFKAYIRWAKENNEYEMSSKKFFSEIGKKLPDKGRNATGIFYKYIRIVGEPKQYRFADFIDGSEEK